MVNIKTRKTIDTFILIFHQIINPARKRSLLLYQNFAKFSKPEKITYDLENLQMVLSKIEIAFVFFQLTTII